MANAKILGEVIDSVSKGSFVRVKGIGYLVLLPKTRKPRKAGKDKA